MLTMKRRTGRGLAGTAGERGACPAAVVLLEDLAQAAHRLAHLALRPAARAEGLHQLVGVRLGLDDEGEAHARAAGGRRRELVHAKCADPVELAGAPGLDDLVRPVELDERAVRPREAVQRRLDPVARAGAVAVGVLAR